MSVKVLIPTPLRPFTSQQSVVQADGRTVGEVLRSLTTTHGELAPHLFSSDGRLRSFVNIYVGDEDIRFLDGLDTKLEANCEISIVPAIAGGSRA